MLLVAPDIVLVLAVETIVFKVIAILVAHSLGDRDDRHGVVAVPGAILRGDAIDDRALGEIVDAAVGGSHDGSGSNGKVGGKGGDVGLAANSEADVGLVGNDIDKTVAGLVKHGGRVVGMYPCLDNVALGIGSLVFEARGEREQTQASP